MKDREFDEERLREELKSGTEKVTQKDLEKTVQKSQKIVEKVKSSSVLSREFAKVRLLIMLIKDYWDGNYKKIPRGTIAAVVFTLLYILSPFDLIPDFIPFFGYADDLALLLILWAGISEDVKRYAKWKAERDEVAKKLYFEIFEGGGGALDINLDIKKLLLKIFRGKKIAILGAGATGKTRLLDFLEDGNFSYSKYESTLSKEKKKDLTVNIGKGQVLVRETYDIPGHENVDMWFTPKEYNQFDYVFYLFRTPCLFCDSKDGKNCVIAKEIGEIKCEGYKEYLARIKSDINNLLSSYNINKNKIMLVGTFCDLMKEFNEYLKNKQIGNFSSFFLDKILEKDYEIFDKFKLYKNVFGSLKNEDYAKFLVEQMFQQLKNEWNKIYPKGGGKNEF